MATEITMPKLGLTMKVGRVGKWLKKEGDPVRKGEAIAEVLTDKITNVLEAAAEGVLLRIAAPVGAQLPVGGLMGYIGAAGESLPGAPGAAGAAPAVQAAQPAAAAAAPVTGAAPGSGEKRPRATPVARKLAEQHGIDLSRLAGTGPNGSIVREDVEKALAQGLPLEVPSAPAEPEAIEVMPYAGIRQVIGENMLRSWLEIPKVDHHASVDMTELLAARRAINEGLPESGRVTVTDLLVLLTARALEMKRIFNALMEPDGIKIHRNVHMGIAIALEDGLVVPVVRDANKKRLREISAEIRDLAARARENRLTESDFAGGTFTLTNLGGYRSTEHFTPVINPPQAAILGIGRTRDVPVAVDGEVRIRPMMALSLSHDHRIVDGAPAAEFLGILMRMIEAPSRALY